MEAYQKTLINSDTTNASEERLSQDESDQIENSPGIDGLQTMQSKEMA